MCYIFSGVTLFSSSSPEGIESVSSRSIENYDDDSTAAVQCTGQAQILIEGINFAAFAVVLMLIVCLARLIHLRFSRALRTMMVMVQLLFSTGQA